MLIHLIEKISNKISAKEENLLQTTFIIALAIPFFRATGVIIVNTVEIKVPNKRVYFPPILADNNPPAIYLISLICYTIVKTVTDNL